MYGRSKIYNFNLKVTIMAGSFLATFPVMLADHVTYTRVKTTRLWSVVKVFRRSPKDPNLNPHLMRTSSQ